MNLNHKIIIFFINLLCVQSYTIFALQDNESFQQGNKLFLQGNYAQACKMYDKIENKGFSVLYNMQLCYAYQNKLGKAFLYGKRAEKQASFNQLTQLYDFFNAMHQQIDSDYSIEWYDQLAIFIKKCILSVPMIFLQIFVVLIIILLLIAWHRSWYVIPKRLFFIAVFIGLFFIIFLISKISIIDKSVGMVIKDEITVFAGPDTSFYKKLQLHESDEVIIINKQQGFYQVKTKKIIGWVCDNDIELV